MKSRVKLLAALLAGIFVISFANVSCSNGSDTAGIGLLAGGGTQPGVNVDDGGTVTINTKNLKYIGEESETVDGVSYNVKKYADLLLDDNPYFYTYYKFYYLNGKLRRLYKFEHGVGSNMDYKYTDFVEHYCGNSVNNHFYIYFDNGKIESYTQKYGSNATVMQEYFYSFYPNGNNKLWVFKQDGKVSSIQFFYSSGYYKYYFTSGKFYTFADNITKTADTSKASSSGSLTQDQAEAKLAELMNE